MIRVQSLSFFQNIYQYHTSSIVHNLRIIRAATTVVSFCFQGQLWGGFTSTEKFLSVASLQALTHPEVFFNEIWNIHLKVFFWNRCSKYFWEIPTKTSVKELIFSKFLSFQHGFGCKWFSPKFSVHLLQRTQLAELYSFHLIIP